MKTNKKIKTKKTTFALYTKMIKTSPPLSLNPKKVLNKKLIQQQQTT